MLLLALDTSTSAITAALLDLSDSPGDSDESGVSGDSDRSRVADAPRAPWVRRRIDVRGHAEWLSSQIVELLAQAGRRAGEVTHVVAGEGPGPFTGLRVGLVTAETFAFATGARYAGVCSLDALAFAAVREGAVGGDGGVGREGGSDGAREFLVATDARRKEVYWALYVLDEGQAVPRRVSDPAVAKPADLPERVRALPCVGRGATLYPELLPNAAGPLDVDAGELARLAELLLREGRLEMRERAQPLYLRRPDAVPSVPPVQRASDAPAAAGAEA